MTAEPARYEQREKKPLPPGVFWDWRTKQIKRDRLAQLEDRIKWLSTPQRQQMEALRDEYLGAEGAILFFLEAEPSGVLLEEQIAAVASEIGVNEQTLYEVAERMFRSGRLIKDYAGPSNGQNWFHWYTLPPEANSTNGAEENEDEADSRRSDGKDGSKEERKAGSRAAAHSRGGIADLF